MMNRYFDANTLYEEFLEQYPFVSISRRDVDEYYRNMHGKQVRVDLLLDYILSQGLEEDIEL